VNYEELVQRILHRVDEQAYHAEHVDLDEDQLAPINEALRALRDPSQGPNVARAMAHRFLELGVVDPVNALSLLHVIAASPQVADYSAAARLVAEQETAALTQGGPRLQKNLASVERHRGVLAFKMGRYEIALDYFSRAFERQHIAGNLANVLCTLIRLGEVSDARDLRDQVFGAFPAPFIRELRRLIQLDPDLALLRKEDH
jgi:tetratricopeptide (TPR) repeat protein